MIPGRHFKNILEESTHFILRNADGKEGREGGRLLKEKGEE